MNDLEKKLMNKASKMHDKIFPCASDKDFKHCFSRENNRLYFWYNTEDKSTHVIAADIRQAKEKKFN
jgi:hypothetical protein